MKLSFRSLLFTGFVLFTFSCTSSSSPEQEKQSAASETPEVLKVLIIDGENNHGAWPKTTAMMKDYLEQTGRFTVDVERTAYTWQGPHNDKSVGGEENRKQLIKTFAVAGESSESVEEPVPDANFKPDFSKYDVVLSNFGWNASLWPQETQTAFESYIKNGGGLVVIHAANNSFGEWDEYNKMIGIGGWGGRNEKTGPYVYYNGTGELVRDTSAGGAGGHGPQHEFAITTRAPEHPIMKGLPTEWMHTKDELYEKLRGPAENIEVLATAYSDPEKNGGKNKPATGFHQPMLMTIQYGQGRVFHSIMGHTDYSQECVGFIVTLQRGTEWAATGEVTLTDVPADFPTAEQSSKRAWNPVVQ